MSMKPYTVFAGVYDGFMDDIPYEFWADKINGYLKKMGFKEARVLELGCGTGNFTRCLAERGYHVKGTDLSEEMLRQARRKLPGIDFAKQDMRFFSEKERYHAIVSVCDSVNYLQNYDDLEQMLVCVRRALTDDGVLIFDVKTEKFFRQLGDNVFTDEIPEGSYIWENEYDEETRNNYYYITFYLKALFGLYRKYAEEHVQHAFLHEEICGAAGRAGLALKSVLDEDFKHPANKDADRLYYIFERKKKHD